MNFENPTVPGGKSFSENGEISDGEVENTRENQVDPLKIFPPKPGPVELVPLAHRSREDVIRYLSEFPGEDRGEEFWKGRLEFWWDKNPSCNGKFDRGWLLTHGPDIVGIIAAIPGSMMLDSRESPVVALGLWRVLPSHRNHSLKLILQFIKVFKNDFIFSCTHNQTIYEILKALKFKGIPGGYSKRYGYVLNMKKYLSVKFGMDNPVFNLLAEPAAWIYNKWMLPKHTAPENSDTQLIGGPEYAGLETLWESSQFNVGTTNSRRPEILNWFTNEHPLGPRERVELRRGGALVGYALFRNKPRTSPLVTWECLDLWAHKMEPVILRDLLVQCIARARENRVDVLTCGAFNEALEAVLVMLGMRPFKSRGMEYLVKGPAGSGFKAGGTHYFVAAQGDYGP